MFEQIKQLAALHDKLFFQLLRGTWDRSWSCTISLEADGLELKVRTEQDSPEWAVDEAYVKFNRLVKEGAPQLLKVITHQPAPLEPYEAEDIPF